MGDGQHCGEIASQLDSQLALLRNQDDRINEPTERLRRFQAGAIALQRRGELFDLLPVEVGHARMQERRRLVGGLDLVLKFVPPCGQAEHLFFALRRRYYVVEHQVQQLLAARFDLRQFAFRRVQSGALLHPQPVHFLRELAAELLEEILAKQLRLERAQDA